MAYEIARWITLGILWLCIIVNWSLILMNMKNRKNLLANCDLMKKLILEWEENMKEKTEETDPS